MQLVSTAAPPYLGLTTRDTSVCALVCLDDKAQHRWSTSQIFLSRAPASGPDAAGAQLNKLCQPVKMMPLSDHFFVLPWHYNVDRTHRGKHPARKAPRPPTVAPELPTHVCQVNVLTSLPSSHLFIATHDTLCDSWHSIASVRLSADSQHQDHDESMKAPHSHQRLERSSICCSLTLVTKQGGDTLLKLPNTPKHTLALM